MKILEEKYGLLILDYGAIEYNINYAGIITKALGQVSSETDQVSLLLIVPEVALK